MTVPDRRATNAPIRGAGGLPTNLPADLAAAHGHRGPLMVQTLRVASDLQGVGRAAAAWGALAAAGIACDVVAGRSRGPLVVPEARAEEARAILRAPGQREAEA